MTGFFNNAGLLGEYGSLSNKTTSVNTYADVGTVDTRFARTRHFYFAATTNTLSVQILGSLDGGVTFPITVEAAFDVTVASPVSKTYAPTVAAYTHLKVQVKPKVNDTHGTLATQYYWGSF